MASKMSIRSFLVRRSNCDTIRRHRTSRIALRSHGIDALGAAIALAGCRSEPLAIGSATTDATPTIIATTMMVAGPAQRENHRRKLSP